ncbi:hypothetical protein OX459_23030 [Janthinobacterium sp. SUN026]|uniref:hypothetical protein n=1 Tax=Janthinobacterium sp. SUN026 TaxID=3002438 RepID=UPI0025B19992|nr:hypothetical protein [Janthinobacterium sp. SUN026]MDN2674271.1 hypothetical protein [Janthinobacterium sp. SUN026]
MRPWLRRGLLTVSVFALSWTGAIAYWRDSTRMPTPGELAGAMLALPLALLLMLWLGKKLLARLLAGPALAAPGLAAPLQAEAATPPVAPLPLHIVAATLRMPGGATPSELLAAMRSRQARPALDGQLLDEDGYPLLCGRVDGIDEEEQQQVLAAWLREHPQAGLASEPFPFNPEDVRALALGAEVLAELVDEALQHALSAGARASPASAPPMLRLHLLMPTSWSAAQRQAGDAWLRHLAREQGWPAQTLPPPADAANRPPAPFALLNQLAGHAAPPQPPGLSIVLACDSHLGELRVHVLASQGQLFSASQANGQIPGEGAAGLLLAIPGATAPPDEPAPVLLHRAATGELPQGASQRGPADKSMLAELGRQALAAAGDDAAAGIALVSADTDQRANRVLELMQCAGAILPQLDLGEQVLGVGTACGQCGAVTTLAALAMARQAAADDGAHVLCLSNLDPLQRGALVIGPRAKNSHGTT